MTAAKGDRSWSGTRYRRVDTRLAKGKPHGRYFRIRRPACAGHRGVQRARPALCRRPRAPPAQRSPSPHAESRRWRRPWSRSAPAGAKAQSVRMDVTDAGSVENAFAEAEARFGPVTILINNAGVTITRPALDMDGKRLDERDRHQSQGRLAGRAARRAADGPPRHAAAVSSTSPPSPGCAWPAASHPMRSRRPAWCR